ncbi:GNAT family N-acetyltransferase [Marinicrinis lubricantis]|uniref:GNAT family N-acetyltransferase n=1 Tax=Marinicrinis lubricantis TaxID=2086470 RepID=A0ABW1IW20_9BACL
MAMTEYRMVRPEELLMAVRLADATFRNDEQISMGKAFPHVFSSSMAHSFGAFVEGELVSFIGLVPNFIRIHESLLSVYSIGAVCTNPEHRGAGHASKLLDLVVDYADKAGASLLLVSGDRSLYLRKQCVPFGIGRKYVLSKDADQRQPRYQIREYHSNDLLRISRLASSRAVRYVHSPWDVAQLIGGGAFSSCIDQKQHILLAEDGRGVVAFAVIAAPTKDGQHGRAMEWAGEEEAVRQLLLTAVHRHHMNALEVPVMSYEHELNKLLSTYPSEQIANSGTVKVLNAQRLLEQLQPYLMTYHSAELAAEHIGSDEMSLKWSDGEKKMSASEFAACIFSGVQPQSMPAEFQKQWDGAFPLPFPYTCGLNFV